MEWRTEWRMVEPMLLEPKQFDLRVAKNKEEPVEEPVQRLLHASKEAGVADKVAVLEEGKTRFF